MNDCTFCDNDRCIALVEKKCSGCSFHKTTEELIRGRLNSEKRIRTLPKTAQIYIKRKYYSRGNKLE